MAERRSYVGRLLLTSSLACLVWSAFPRAVKADKPYFVTYDDEMEEPGNLEVSFNPLVGLPQSAPISWAAGLNSNMAPPAGGRPNFTSTRRPPAARVVFSLATAGKTGSILWQTSTGSIQCSTWNSKTSMQRTKRWQRS